jgi:hypothetical protein
LLLAAAAAADCCFVLLLLIDDCCLLLAADGNPVLCETQNAASMTSPANKDLLTIAIIWLAHHTCNYHLMHYKKSTW